MTLDIQKVARTIIDCADIHILPLYKMLASHQISTKTGPNDLVTHADINAEEYLKSALPTLFADSIVIGEEGVSKGDVTLDALKTGQPVWVVDPVDGTYNFAHGKRDFAVMVALVYDGKTQAGWIYDILGKAMAVAVRGQGAHLNEKPLKVASQKASAKNCTGYISPFFYKKKNKERYEQAVREVRKAKFLRCAGMEYLNIAKGEDDFGFFNRLKPWDHLAGTLLVEEAGGYVRMLDGGLYTPSIESGGLIVASSEKVWKGMYDIFAKGIV